MNPTIEQRLSALRDASIRDRIEHEARERRGLRDATRGHQRPAVSVLDAPDWPDAPTEEITHPEANP
jgi:hypothetical protein